MVRKIIWGGIILVVAWVWFSSVLNSCDGGVTKSKVSQLTEGKEEVFQYDEDAEDDEYIAQDSDDDPDEDDIIENKSKSDTKSVEKAKKEWLEKSALLKEKSKQTAQKIEKKISNSVKDVVEKGGDKLDKATTRIVEKKNPNEKIPVSDKASLEGDYLVVAGSFSNEIYADEFVNKLQGMGYRDTEKIIFDFSKYFSVIAGRYSSEKQAKNRELELKKKGVDAYTHQVRSKFFDE